MKLPSRNRIIIEISLVLIWFGKKIDEFKLFNYSFVVIILNPNMSDSL